MWKALTLHLSLPQADSLPSFSGMSEEEPRWRCPNCRQTTLWADSARHVECCKVHCTAEARKLWNEVERIWRADGNPQAAPPLVTLDSLCEGTSDLWKATTLQLPALYRPIKKSWSSDVPILNEVWVSVAASANVNLMESESPFRQQEQGDDSAPVTGDEKIKSRRLASLLNQCLNTRSNRLQKRMNTSRLAMFNIPCDLDSTFCFDRRDYRFFTYSDCNSDKTEEDELFYANILEYGWRSKTGINEDCSHIQSFGLSKAFWILFPPTKYNLQNFKSTNIFHLVNKLEGGVIVYTDRTKSFSIPSGAIYARFAAGSGIEVVKSRRLFLCLPIMGRIATLCHSHATTSANTFIDQFCDAVKYVGKHKENTAIISMLEGWLAFHPSLVRLFGLKAIEAEQIQRLREVWDLFVRNQTRRRFDCSTCCQQGLLMDHFRKEHFLEIVGRGRSSPPRLASIFQVPGRR